MNAIIRAIGHREGQWIAALELVVELLLTFSVHLAVSDFFRLPIKYQHRSIIFGQRGNAADRLGFLQA